MNELRIYLTMLDKIQEEVDNLPMMEFDYEISSFYEKVSTLIGEHRSRMEERLNSKEKSI